MINELSTGQEVATAVNDLLNNPSGSELAEAINDAESGGGGDEPVETDGKTIRVCSWNVGHFSIGVAAQPIICDDDFTPPTQYVQKYTPAKNAWLARLRDINADVMLASEFDTYFKKTDPYGNITNLIGTPASVTAWDAVFKEVFSGFYNGNANNFSHNAIMAKSSLSNGGSVTYGDYSGSGMYYAHALVTIDGKSVHLVATHLSWSTPLAGSQAELDGDYPGSKYRYYRAKQMKQLISTFSSEQYVIIAGDFNVDNVSEFDGEFGQLNGETIPSTDPNYVADFNGFSKSGFILANHGKFGDILTYPASGCIDPVSSTANRVVYQPNNGKNYPYAYLDNIIFKGFTLNSVRIIDEPRRTDHCGLVAELTIL